MDRTAAVCVDGIEDDRLIEAAKDVLSSCTRIEAWCAYGSEAERFVRDVIERHHGPHPHAHDPPHASLDAEQAEAIAERGAMLLTHAGFPATAKAFGGRDAGHAIADASNPDVLVVVAAGHRRDLGPKSIGHVARFVIDHARGPVLVLRLPT
jgi:nucleotide-binding universal stress UspA family protein